MLTLTEGSLVIPLSATPGETSSFQVFPGTYNVAAAELANQDQTVVATAQVSFDTITVMFSEEAALDVAYPQVDTYSAIDVTIGDISPLEREPFHATVVRSSETLADFWGPAKHTTSLRRLPSSGTIDVSIDMVSLNNIQYSSNTKSVDVSTSLFSVTFSQADEVLPIGTTGFVQLPIVVTTDLLLDADLAGRLVGPSPDNFIYTQQVESKPGTTMVAVLVAP